MKHKMNFQCVTLEQFTQAKFHYVVGKGLYNRFKKYNPRALHCHDCEIPININDEVFSKAGNRRHKFYCLPCAQRLHYL